MRGFKFIILIFVFIIPWSNSLGSKGVICENSENPCVCIFPNDAKIDLSLLGRDTTNFTSIASDTTVFFYNPCKDFAIPASNLSTLANAWLFTLKPSNVTKKLIPNDVLSGKENGTFLPITKAESAKFEGTEWQENTAVVSYTNVSLKLIVNLDCKHNHKSDLAWPNPAESATFNLQLSGEAACPTEIHRGLSTGSVLVVITLVFALAYLIGGALILKFVRGAEGPEMIPNYEFWSGLPSLVRDGFIFAVSCGRTRPDTYDRI